MCVILTCQPNCRPSDDVLRACFAANPDGAGLAYAQRSYYGSFWDVVVDKGYFSPDRLIDAVHAIPEDAPMLIHFRIATSGSVDAHGCHPYPVSPATIGPRESYFFGCDLAVAHNGIIHGVYTSETDSDTLVFVRDYLSKLELNSVTDVWEKANLIELMAPGNRFAFIDATGRILELGSGWEDVCDGVRASNSSWRPLPTSVDDPLIDYWQGLVTFDDLTETDRDYVMADYAECDFCPHREDCVSGFCPTDCEVWHELTA